MPILYPIAMLIILAVLVLVAWKVLLKMFPELQVISKRADIAEISAAAEVVKDIDQKKAKKNQKIVETFIGSNTK